MKKTIAICVVLSLVTTPVAMAQGVPGAQGGQAPRPLRPVNLPNPPGTDSGAGPACDQLTSYGEIQPPGPAPKPYGKGAPPPPPPTPLPEFSPAIPARADSTLGAAGIDVRGVSIPDAPALAYRFAAAPQPPRGTIGFANVNGVGLLKDGRLVVNQRMPMYQVLVYAADGRLLRNLDPNIQSRPHGMRIDSADNIWMTDQQCNTVTKINANGDVLLRLGTSGKAGTWNEAKGERLFNQPTDIAFAPNGDLYVSTGHGGPDPRVLHFDKAGKFINTWSMAHAEGPNPTIHTMVVRKNGEVYVGDREAKKIRVFDANGKLLREIPQKNLICGLYVDSKDQLWMTTGMDGMVLKLGWDGKVLGVIGKSGFGATDFGEAHYMTMSADAKTMYVSDTVNNDIKKILIG